MTNIKDIEFGLEIHELEKRLAKKNIALIGLSSSIVGYSPRAFNFLDSIVRAIKFRPKNFTVFNAHFQNLGRDEHITDLIESNISLADVKKINREEANNKAQKIMQSMHLPKDGKLIPIVKTCYGIKTRDIQDDDNTIFLKSSIINNEEMHIFYSSDVNISNKESVNLDLQQRKRNFETILSLNPNAQIYAIGLITPNKKDTSTIQEINESFKKIASNFGAIYIDPIELNRCIKKDIDSHYLSEEGTMLLSLKCIEAMYNAKVNNDDKPASENMYYAQSVTENSLNYLLKRSLERTEELKTIIEDLDGPIKQKLALLKQLECERAQQEIYQKIKKKELI